MANVIDALIVTLGLDPAQFKRGAKEAGQTFQDITDSAEKSQGKIDEATRRGAKSTKRAQHGVAKGAAETAKRTNQSQGAIRKTLSRTEQQASRSASLLQSKGKQGGEFFDPLIEGATTLLGVLGAIKSIQEGLQSMAATAGLGRLAGNIGMPTQQLSAWGLAAARFGGGSADAAQASVVGLEQQQQAFRTTGKPNQTVALLQNMGVSPYATTQQALMGVAAWMGTHSQQEDYTRGKMLGLDDGLINILEKGQGAVAGYLKQVAPDAVTKNQTEAMQRLQTVYVSLTQDVDALGRKMMEEWSPAITNILDLIKKFGDYSGDILGPILQADAKLLADITGGKWSAVPGDVANVLKADKEGAKIFAGTAKPVADSIDYSTYSAIVDATTNKSQKLSRDQIMGTLIAGGMSKQVAAAFTGNAMKESSLKNINTTFDPKSGNHYGLWQVSEAIRQQILRGAGIDMASASTQDQAKGLLWYLKNNPDGKAAYSSIKGAKDAVSAALLVNDKFERSGDGTLGLTKRAAYAMNAFHSYDAGSQAKDQRLIDQDKAIQDKQRAAVNGVLEENQRAHAATSIPLSVQRVIDQLKAAQTASYGVASIAHADHSVKTETHIGNVTVNTQAKDPKAVAGAISGLGTAQNRAVTANTGLN